MPSFSCTQSYHHFEDPVHITRALVQRLKPNGRLFVIDFLTGDGIDNFFGKIHEHQSPASHTVVHKHGRFIRQLSEHSSMIFFAFQ